MNNDPTPGDAHDLLDGMETGSTGSRGDDSAASSSHSVIDRIGEITGSKPQVLLRADPAGDPSVLTPLGQSDRIDAGKYIVHGELGRGGVGTVYRGRDQDLGRDVAMKFLHDKYKDEPQILHRFVEEAQIGGQLQHPGIVPVYDLGMANGKPFFSMKLVEGKTLAKKLAERGSPTDDRRDFIAIFEDVCQTLAYAHARGVVHRDLKPANIMIGSFGEVQVVDWGMGKVLDSSGDADEKLAAEQHAKASTIQTVRTGDHGTQSLVGSMMGTPAYMPPEQARGDVEAMDERSDVFTLGAILCEILTGKPPYVGPIEEQIVMAGMAELDDAKGRLEACVGEPEMVELALKCLMPAPAERPKSAEIVAQIVHTHLAAVEARVHEARVEAAEAKVRAKALKRTQKLGISLTAVIAAGLLLSLWFWRAADTAATNEGIARGEAVASAMKAQKNEQVAIEQTGVAERELARAIEIKTLITEMLRSVAPENAIGADISLLKGILDTASRRLTDGVIEDDLVAAELHGLVGSVYNSIGLYPEAELHLPVALGLYKGQLGAEHPDTLETMSRLGNLYRDLGRYDDSESLHLQSLEARRRLL
ncbi:MAG: serine/threonine protein kinase, partial [Planctomycetota bacterium]